ncbi:hypothetical protein HGM15179_012157 [Zosterops borbonicus]|uniref:Uncharacterized protein n=1 Tax=Zosterops borbonicus TaxID=364589 RepID=A0A8K1GAB5_9PASS|nr:hypothetical protein HGM15179_012157 [Zosterops borbonicus]
MLFFARSGCTKSADAKETALDWAVKHGNLEMAEMVAKAGVDVNAKSVIDSESKQYVSWCSTMWHFTSHITH